MITEVTKNHFAKLTPERKKKLIESNKVARRWKKLKSNQEAGKSLDKNELENLVYGDKNSSSSDDKVSKPNISIGEGKPLLENTAEDKKKEGGEEEEGVIDDPMFGGLGGRRTTILTDYAEIVKPMRVLWKALTQKERMPYLSEDVINDYIKPSREFRTSLVLEVDEHMRTALYNSLVNLNSIIHDMLNIIDNADNKNKLE
jgi:hypothetical protein